MLRSSMLTTTRSLGLHSLHRTLQNGCPARVVLRRIGKEPKETSQGQDSYSKIEAPVREGIPDGGPPVDERNWGQEKLNPKMKAESADPSMRVPGSQFSATEVFRFAGAVPEIANSRLAMLGIVAALAAELATGQNVAQQFKSAPFAIVVTFFTIILATAVPVFRGLPRRGNQIWSSDAELINGRFAMVGFLGLVISTYFKGSALWFL